MQNFTEPLPLPGGGFDLIRMFKYFSPCAGEIFARNPIGFKIFVRPILLADFIFDHGILLPHLFQFVRCLLLQIRYRSVEITFAPEKWHLCRNLVQFPERDRGG